MQENCFERRKEFGSEPEIENMPLYMYMTNTRNNFVTALL